MRTNDYDGRLTDDVGEFRRFALGCCLGLLLSLPIWACIALCLVGLLIR